LNFAHTQTSLELVVCRPQFEILIFFAFFVRRPPMKLSQQVLYAIDDAGAGKFDAALLHACISIDTTSKRLYPSESKVGHRYVTCLRDYYWIVEPMIGAGLNLVETRFSNVPLQSNRSPDLADVIYEIFRCSHAHGDEVPPSYSIIPTEGSVVSKWGLGRGELHMPDRIIWALLAIAVFSKVNAGEKSVGTYYLSLGDDRFPVCDWWGREDDFRPVADRYNQTRVKLDKLDRLGADAASNTVESVRIIRPYAASPPLGTK
jgi:hypothetical protein